MTQSTSNIITAVKHGGKVALHVVAAILVYGVVGYLTHHPDSVSTLANYGITIGLTNSILAGVWQWLNLPIQDIPTIDSLPE